MEGYHRPFDARRPLIGVDETSKPWIGEGVQPLPAAPGQPERFDYVRNGTAHLFMRFAPLLRYRREGGRAVRVTERRTAQDFAEVVRWRVEDLYRDAEQGVRVADNLNTHTPAALYTVFAPEQARRIAERIEWHDTPPMLRYLSTAAG
jgi:hypothetical protein